MILKQRSTMNRVASIPTSPVGRSIATLSRFAVIVLLFGVYAHFLFAPIKRQTKNLLAHTYQPSHFDSFDLSVGSGQKTLGAEYSPSEVMPAINGLDSYSSDADYPEYIEGDTRVLALREFLRDYNSPMYPFAHVFVREADKYGLDWRLVASISGIESAFGQYVPQKAGYSYNAWGWTGNPDPAIRWRYFSGWSEGIAVVTKGLATGYGTDLTPYQIVPSYCPDCYESNGPWPDVVSRYMNELSAYERRYHAQ